MESTSELAGFFAAHGVLSVWDGGPLVPLAGFEGADGSRQMKRFATERIEEGVQAGLAWLEANPEDVLRAVLVYDGYVTLPSGKTDALIVDARLYGSSPGALVIAVPYRPGTEQLSFAVFRPKFVSCDPPATDLETLGAAFFRGVEGHAEGAAVWSRSLDESQ